jgi:enamine deaminase RidA (YjgF/YER057c/UK114 family)
MTAEERLVELGLVLPEAPPDPAGSYRWTRHTGDLLFLAGHGPLQPNGAFVMGKVGADLDVDEGREAARLTGLALLASMRHHLGSLDRVVGIVKVLGMVNVAPGFMRLPEVIDGCSDLLVDVFGPEGEHARSAVGMAALPFGIAVEIELVAEVA